MKRIITVLAVAALMAVMVAAMAAPAMASKFFPGQAGNCGQKGVSIGETFPDLPDEIDFITAPSKQDPDSDGKGIKNHECQN